MEISELQELIRLHAGGNQAKQDVMQEAALAQLRVCGRVLASWNLKRIG